MREEGLHQGDDGASPQFSFAAAFGGQGYCRLQVQANFKSSRRFPGQNEREISFS